VPFNHGIRLHDRQDAQQLREHDARERHLVSPSSCPVAALGRLFIRAPPSLPTVAGSTALPFFRTTSSEIIPQREDNLIDFVVGLKKHRPLCHRYDGYVIAQEFMDRHEGRYHDVQLPLPMRLV
jgi:hypothetical protein